MEYTLNFPKTLDALRVFIAERSFNLDRVDDALCGVIVRKVADGDLRFSPEEIALMRRISDIGDVCTCDTDHRVGPDGRTFACAKS